MAREIHCDCTPEAGDFVPDMQPEVLIWAPKAA